MEELQENQVGSCPNCKYPLQPDHAFCASCGQQRIRQSDSFATLFGSFLGDYFTFDSKITGSIRPLLFLPGALTQAYIAGRRARYISPLRLYIFISLIFFLILSWGRDASPLQSSTNADSEIWNEFFGNYFPKLFFLFLPLFAGLLAALVRKKRGNYISCLVFALHYHGMVFITLIFYLLLSRFFAAQGWYMVNTVLLSVLFFWFLIYLYIAMRRVFQLGWLSLSAKFLALLIAYFGILSITLLVITGLMTFSNP